MSSVLRSLAWSLAALLLYGSVLLLDLYWNVLNWRPRWDGLAAGLLFGAVLALAAMLWLARSPWRPLTRCVSLLISLVLLSAAIYALPPEAVSEGVTGREAASPTWYRGARLLLLGCPVVLGLWNWSRRRTNPPR